jgi:hypothetical protein
VLALVVGAGAARADVTPAELEAQLSEVRLQLSPPDLSPEARAALLTRLDELQRRLIAAAPADDRQATWLADRCATALERAAAEGVDVAVLVGVPTPARADRARALAAEASGLAERASEAASRTVARLEAQLVDRSGGADAKAKAEAAEASLQTLIEVEQGQRIPYLRALAKVLLCAAQPDRVTRDGAQAAARELAQLAPATPALDASRRVALGLALVHAVGGPTGAGRVPADKGAEVLSAAAAQLRPVAEGYAPGARGAEGATALRARLALIRAGADAGSRPRGADGAVEAELDLLEAEAKAAALLDRSRREPSRQAEHVGAAVKGLLAQAGGGDEGRRARVYELVSACVPAGVGLETLPPEATLARGVTMARLAGPGDRAARSEAAGLLAGLAARADAPAELRCRARWERAVILAGLDDAPAELDAVAEVLRAPEGCAEVPRAARRIVELFARQQRASGGAGAGLAALPEAWRARAPALREALAALVKSDAKDAERWRGELARLVAGEIAEATTLDALAAALTRADGVAGAGGAAPPVVADALWRVIDGRRGAAAEVTSRAGETSGRLSWGALAPWAGRALAWARAADKDREPAYALVLGEALSGAGDAQALAVLDGLSGGPVDHPDSPLWARFRMALGRAQRTAGEDAKAMATFRSVADRYEGAPGTSAREPAYWAAWCEMLELLQAQAGSGERAGDVRAAIKRLELLDPNLGGSPWAERIRAVRAKVGE